MAVKLYTTIQRFIGLTTDTKPESVPVGSIFEEQDNNGKEYKYNGSTWEVTNDNATESKQDDIIAALAMALEADALKGTATGGSTTTIEDTTKNFKVDMWKGSFVEVEVSGTKYLRLVQSNTVDTITIATIGDAVTAGDEYTIKLPISATSINKWGNTALTGRDISSDIAKLDLEITSLRNAITGTAPNNSTLNDLATRLGEVSATPTSNTVLARLQSLLTGIVLANSTNVIGQVGIDQTTDGTTNKVQARNATRADFKTDSTLQLAGVDVTEANPVPTEEKTNVSLIQGNVTLDGTAQQLSADLECKNITIQANPDNVGYTYIGNSSVSDSVHIAVLSGGSSMTFTVNNANLLYVIGTIADKVSYGGEL